MSTIKWAARLPHVRETTLFGRADLSFWRERLAPEGLAPKNEDDRATIMIVAAASTFMAMRFQELSVSVVLSREASPHAENAAFLLHAYNSSRFFAFCERTLFSTPYSYGDVRVTVVAPESQSLQCGRQPLYSAVRHGTSELETVHHEQWHGAIHLPSRAPQDASRRRFFFAELTGATRRRPFRQDEDEFTIHTPPLDSCWQQLVESSFAPTEWLVREDAQHAKSKTYAAHNSPSV